MCTATKTNSQQISAHEIDQQPIFINLANNLRKLRSLFLVSVSIGVEIKNLRDAIGFGRLKNWGDYCCARKEFQKGRLIFLESIFPLMACIDFCENKNVKWLAEQDQCHRSLEELGTTFLYASLGNSRPARCLRMVWPAWRETCWKTIRNCPRGSDNQGFPCMSLQASFCCVNSPCGCDKHLCFHDNLL